MANFAKIRLILELLDQRDVSEGDCPFSSHRLFPLNDFNSLLIMLIHYNFLYYTMCHLFSIISKNKKALRPWHG